MQPRADEPAGREEAVPVAEQAVIWCGKCGIPYAATMTHCSLCGVPLVDEAESFAAVPQGSQPVVAMSRLPERHQAAETAEAIASLPPTPTRSDATSGRLLGRLRQRQRAMSEDEVDAAAAAIIARARAEERLVAENPLAREAVALLPSYLPDPALAAALQRRRERDRIWLIAGFVCCVVLIIIALAISRYTSSGLLAR